MRVRMGMVGGGEGAFIGEIHRAAARLDDEVVAGACVTAGDVVQRSLDTTIGARNTHSEASP